jgi:hypothetical protein
LQRLDRLYGPKPGMPNKPVVLVLDNGPIHVSKANQAALAERAHWLTVEWLPKYAPELNDIEIVWGDLKSRHLANRTFIDLNSLDSAIHHAVAELNLVRNRDPLDGHEVRCTCKTQYMPLRLMASNRELTRLSLADVLIQLRCEKCRQPQELVALVEDPAGNVDRRIAPPGWRVVLVGVSPP